MGAVGGLLGTSGGASGTGFSTPANANITQPVTSDQVNAANQGVTGSLAGSNALLAALQGQNGVANQGATYGQGNALYGRLASANGVGLQQDAGTTQQDLNGNLGSLNGAGTEGAAMGQQGRLNTALGNAGGVNAQQAAIQGLQNNAAQLQGVANGTGPNPALAALNQATGQNVANQAALMAGQRGAGANVGLIARQAAQQGAQTQQQAAGQAATLQAQQQLNALGQQAGVNQALAGAGAGLVGQQQQGINSLAGQGAAAVGQQQAGIGQQAAIGAGLTGQQQNQLGMNAGIAQNQVGNTLAANQQNLQGNLGNAGQLLGALGNFNSAQVGSQGSVNAGNTSLAGNAMQGQQGLIGGLLNSAGPAAAAVGGLFAGGGKVKKMADGGSTGQPFQMGAGYQANAAGLQPNQDEQNAFSGMAATPGAQALQKGVSSFGKFLTGMMQPKGSGAGAGEAMAGPDASALPAAAMLAAKGGLASTGGNVVAHKDSQKAEKKGDSYDNDKVPAMLSEGEIVIPRSVMQSADPVAEAAKFVRAHMAKGGRVK